MEYVSPFDERVLEPHALARRPSELSGQRIALLDIAKARGDEFLDRVEVLLRDRGAQIWRTTKPSFSRPAPTALIERVAIHGDLAVEGLAD